MKIIIHRGTNEIGGSCVEISSGETRVLLDIGEQLEPVVKDALLIKRPKQILAATLIQSLNEYPPISAILISHPHRDHFGLLPLLPVSIPVFMTEGSEVMMRLSEYFDQITTSPQKVKHFSVKENFTIGNLSITPILADHSAMDACSFLISDGITRIFYSGDLRAHGRKWKAFDYLIANPPVKIDVLIMEGTLLGRPKKVQESETDLENEMVKQFRPHDDLVLINCSSQNIDRLVTIFRACVKSNRTFVIDPYTAAILDKVHKVHETVPNWNWNNMRIFFTPNKYTERLAKDITDKPLFTFKTAKITIDDIQNDRCSIVMKLNYMNRDILKNKRMLKGSKLIWSQWSEYFNKEEPFWNKQRIYPIHIHTSGHAFIDDLRRLVDAIKPNCIVPIHTFQKNDFPVVFLPTPVRLLEDGETFHI